MDRKIAKRIARHLNITAENFERRKAFLGIEAEDIRRIKAFRALLPGTPPELFDSFYDHLMAFHETRSYFKGDEVLVRLKKKQMAYFDQLFSGNYDMDYMLSRLQVGYVHVQLNIVPLWYIGAYNKYMQGIKLLVDEHAEEKELTYKSIVKVIMMEIVLTLESFHYTKYRLQEELKRMAITDDLTGVFNRRKLEEVMNLEMDRANRTGQDLSVLMVDIDHFKAVNDTHGHQAGDDVLIEITKLSKNSLRESDYVIRYGGEEFLVCMPETSLEEAAQIAERLRRVVAEHTFDTVGHITISIGVSGYDKGESQETFIKRADQKLYDAKQSGRNRVCF